MENEKIAEIFQEIGDILEIKGDSIFRIRSYHRAAQVIRNYPYDLKEIYEQNPDALDDIPGIGASLSEKIIEILTTGTCKIRDKLLKDVGKGLVEIMRVRGIGPKKVKLFYQELKIDSLKKLESAARRGLLRTLSGMGEKSERDILKALIDYSHFHERSLLSLALGYAEEYMRYLEKSKDILRLELAGSIRRRTETIGDIDILAIPRSKKVHEKVMDYFCNYPEVDKILVKGDTKSSILLSSGIQVDLRVIDKQCFGAALQYFIGSKAHNVALRNIAKRKGLKISEYGVFKGDTMIAGATEESVYKTVSLPYIIPELRENRGEIEAAQKNLLPKSIELDDIRGDLHTHTSATDGSLSIEEMAKAAQVFGHDYIAITDHSKSVHVANGLSDTELLTQMKAVLAIDKKMRGFRILTGVEVDVLGDGRLDASDAVLKQLDIVVMSVHSKFQLSQKEQTERVIRGLKNPYVKIFGHPTARHINKRNPISLDMEKVMRAAKAFRVAMEINANPLRLDLNDVHVKMAKDMGVKIVISTDAHHSSQFSYMKFGVFMARRGWLEKEDVLNTRSCDSMLSYWKSP